MTTNAIRVDQPPGVQRLEIAIRPGIMFPNWSAIASEAATDTLNAILDLGWAKRCWEDYGESEDRVRRGVLEGYLVAGQAPSVIELATRASMSANEVRKTLEKLKARDLIVLDEASMEVVGAYPLTNRASEHQVQIGDTKVNAMCAIDALGTGAMYGRNTKIDSSCRSCESSIRMETRDAGTALKTFAPTGSVVWSGIQYEGGCAANSLCTVIAFFCSSEHLASWRQSEMPDAKGYRLSMGDAFQVGVALFSPALMRAAHDPEQNDG